MQKPPKPQATMAVEILYNNIASLPHPDMGNLRLVYFGHQSDGQKKLTRNVAEAIVMLLEANGHFICNGLDEAAELLKANGYIVASPVEVDGVPVPSPVPSAVPLGVPFEDFNQLKLGE